MIQKGAPVFIQVTFDAPNLKVAARVFDASGPVGAWTAMVNFDGNSYRLPYTFADEGAYSAKMVVFTDLGFTVRDTEFNEADTQFQVVDLSTSGGGGGSSASAAPSVLIGEIVAPAILVGEIIQPAILTGEIIE